MGPPMDDWGSTRRGAARRHHDCGNAGVWGLHLSAILPAVLLAACAPGQGGLPQRCGPEFGVMVGRNIGEFDLPRGLPHRIAQPHARLSGPADPGRLTVHVDDKGWVQRVECG